MAGTLASKGEFQTHESIVDAMVDTILETRSTTNVFPLADFFTPKENFEMRTWTLEQKMPVFEIMQTLVGAKLYKQRKLSSMFYFASDLNDDVTVVVFRD